MKAPEDANTQRTESQVNAKMKYTSILKPTNLTSESGMCTGLFHSTHPPPLKDLKRIDIVN